MSVVVMNVEAKDLQEAIQAEKDNGKRILALSPSKIVRGKVTEYVLVTQ